METTVTSEQIYRALEEMGRRVRRVREEAEASLREAEREYSQTLHGGPYGQTASGRHSHPGGGFP